MKKRIMRRVFIIHALRPLTSREAVVVLLFAISFIGIVHEVALPHIFANMPNMGNFYAFDQFWLLAFEHTRLVVQVLTLSVLASTVFLARATARLLIPVVRPAGL